MSVLASVERSVLLRAVKVALLVGTCLTLINQGDVLVQGDPPPTLWWKIPLTYRVPLLVSTYSGLAALRSRH